LSKQLIKGIKSALGFLKREAGFYVFFMVMEIIVSAVFCNIILSVIMQKAVDAIGYGRKELLVEAVGLAIVSFVIAFLFKPFFSQKKSHCVRTVMADLRKRIFGMLIRIKVKNYEKMEQGDILLRVTKDVEKIEQIYLAHLHQLVFALIYGLTASVLMCVYNPFLGAAALGIGMLQTVVDMRIGKKISFFAAKRQEGHAHMLQRVIELLEGYTDIKMSHHSSYFRQKYQDANANFIGQDMAMRKKKRLLDLADDLFGEGSYIGLIILGIWMVFQNKTTIGTVMAVIGLQGNASYLFMNFSTFLAGLSEALPSIERVVELLETEKDKDSSEGEPSEKRSVEAASEKSAFAGTGKKSRQEENNIREKQHMSEYTVELRNLCFGYEADKPVLEQLNMTVGKGELVLIKGESGCGKSTLYKILLGFYQAGKGDYLLNGVSAETMEREKIVEQFAYLDQTGYLFSMTVAENICLGKQNADRNEVEEAAKLAGAHEFIQRLPQGYETVISDGSDNISGGERQRIAMARMFLSDRPILLIDEGTANIDEETENIVVESIQRLKGKKTIIMITHKERLCPYADHIYQIGVRG